MVRTRVRVAVVAAGVTAVALGCRGGERSPPAGEGVPGAGAAAPAGAAAAAVRDVELVVDGAPAGRVAAADLAGRRSLVELLPADARDPARWGLLVAETADGRRLTVLDVGARFPGHDLVLTGDGERPTLAFYPPVRADQPPHVQRALAAPSAALAGVVRVAIERDADGEDGDAAAAARPVEPVEPGLEVVRGDRTVVLDAARLAALPRPDDGRRGGWALADVVAAAGAPGVAVVVATGREGAVSIARDDLPRARLRRNRRGELRLGVEPADGQAEPVVVHAVRRLELR